ncbi:MAG: hypothetical protein NTX61_10225 [Bacteroidetes bacterium]|nr:hypothetical protein [Bacteroidota bacterium]
MNRLFTAVIILCIFCSFQLEAQDRSVKEKFDQKKNLKTKEPEEKENKVIRWNVGINVGMYHANNYSANFYNGRYQNVNNVNYVMSNYYWYQAIKQALGSSDTVVVKDYPLNMHYNITMMAGFFLRYNLSRKYGICLDVNYTQLKATNFVTFDVDPPSYPTFHDIRLIPIQGVEKRVHVDLLLQRNFWLKTKIYIFLQGGLNMNYVRVTKSSIYVEDKEYNMINLYGSQNYIPNTSMQQNQQYQGGFGYGGALHGGIGIPLAGILGIEPGGFINYHNVNLTGYPDYKLSFGFYLRFLFGNILPRPDPDEDR